MLDHAATIRLLHVDDDPDFGDMAATFLEREDDRFEIQVASSPEEARDVLSGHAFDCIVSDYDMPGESGIEFLEAVRENHPELPFILFTGKGSEEIASDAISAGVTEYLQKESGTDQFTVLANRITNAVDHYRSQQELERSQRRLRDVIDALPHLMYVVDENGTYLLANQALAAFHDRTVEEIEGSNVADVLDGPVAAGFLENVASVLERGEARRFDPVEITAPSGEIHLFEPRVRPYEFGASESPAVLGIAADVTEHIERERELRREERRYQAVFNDPNILVGLIDTDGTVLDINRTAMDYVDRPLDDIVGTPFWETPWFTHSEAVQGAVKDWIDRAAGGEYVEFEVELVKPTGDPYWIEGVFRPVTDEDGEVVSLLISDRDITERKERERELREINQWFRAVLDTVEAGIFIKDTESRYQLMNQECRRLLGVGPDEDITGRTDDEFLPEEVAATHRANDRSVLEAEETLELEEEVPTPEGTRINLTLKSPFYDQEGEVQGICGVSTDITERKARETEIKRQNERFDELANMVSHDLQTPLATARGRAELAMETGDLEHVERALAAIERTDSLRKDLLGVLRTKDIVSAARPVDVAGLCERMWETVTSSDDASLEVRDPPKVEGDPDALRRLFENLLSNAVEHGGEDVTVRVGRTDDGFFIEDDGPGIPDDRRDEVFTPGYSTKRDGTGVGLSNVREIVLAHDWHIHITEGTDGGTRFEITGVVAAEA